MRCGRTGFVLASAWELTAYRLHVAEAWVRVPGLREQTKQIMAPSCADSANDRKSPHTAIGIHCFSMIGWT